MVKMALPGEYDRSIYAAAAMWSVATIAVATCYSYVIITVIVVSVPSHPAANNKKQHPRVRSSDRVLRCLQSWSQLTPRSE